MGKRACSERRTTSSCDAASPKDKSGSIRQLNVANAGRNSRSVGACMHECRPPSLPPFHILPSAHPINLIIRRCMAPASLLLTSPNQATGAAFGNPFDTILTAISGPGTGRLVQMSNSHSISNWPCNLFMHCLGARSTPWLGLSHASRPGEGKWQYFFFSSLWLWIIVELPTAPHILHYILNLMSLTIWTYTMLYLFF